ncbi:MAG: SRPBCC domain-containing protein [Acidobacteriota bacterium]
MADILHRITVAADPKTLFETVSSTPGTSSWWTDDNDTAPEVGNVNLFRFNGGAVQFSFRVDQSDEAHIRWTGIRGQNMPEEWLDTRIEFDFTPQADGKTLVDFRHRNWQRVSGEYPQCNTTWGLLMQRLKSAAEGHADGPFFVKGGSRISDVHE